MLACLYVCVCVSVCLCVCERTVAVSEMGFSILTRSVGRSIRNVNGSQEACDGYTMKSNERQRSEDWKAIGSPRVGSYVFGCHGQLDLNVIDGCLFEELDQPRHFVAHTRFLE